MESERTIKLKSFISGYLAGGDYKLDSIPSDAGLRSYYRITAGDKSYVAMDCPPSYASIQKFVEIGKYLLEKGFTAPNIFAEESQEGFLILEDFGSVNVKNYLQSGNYQEKKGVYFLIIDLLISLQEQTPLASLTEFNDEILCKELDVFVNFYIPHYYNRELKVQEFNEFIELWQSVLTKQVPLLQVTVLRDYHLENLMYLEEREGVKKIGLLDFQDALKGSPVYDLVSILEDARFEVPREDALNLVNYYAEKKGLNKEEVLLNYHILGAQRNFRILGVFAHKAIKEHDDYYLRFIPRVRKYLEYDLSHPVFEEIKNWLTKLL